MNIPDEAVQAASKRIDDYYDTPNCVGETAVRHALTAALPFMQGVKVTDLQWFDCAAQTPFGDYTIQFDDDEEMHETPYCLGSPSDNLGHYSDEEAAKSAAQADYEARVLSAIEVTPSPRAQALEEERALSDRLASALEYIDDYSLSYPDLGTISAVAQPALEMYEAVRALASQPVATGGSNHGE